MSFHELNCMPMLEGKRSVVVSTAGLLKAIDAWTRCPEFDYHGRIGDNLSLTRTFNRKSERKAEIGSVSVTLWPLGEKPADLRWILSASKLF